MNFVIFFLFSLLLGASSYALSYKVFSRLGIHPYIWNGTGLPMGIAFALTYQSGMPTFILATVVAAVGGLVGAYLVTKFFPSLSFSR